MSRDVQNTPRMWHRVTIKAENPWLHSTATRGFLVYAYILQKNRAEPHASHATFEGLFEQINRRSQYALVGISLCAATNASLCPQPKFPYAPRSRRRTRPIATAIIAITSAHKNVTPTSPAA